MKISSLKVCLNVTKNLLSVYFEQKKSLTEDRMIDIGEAFV